MIKNCPFCGHKAEVAFQEGDGGDYFRVSCGTHYLDMWVDTPEKAIEEWNMRYEEPVVIEKPIKSKLSFISKGEVAIKEEIKKPKTNSILKSTSCSFCSYRIGSNECINCLNYVEEFKKLMPTTFNSNIVSF